MSTDFCSWLCWLVRLLLACRLLLVGGGGGGEEDTLVLLICEALLVGMEEATEVEVLNSPVWDLNSPVLNSPELKPALL